MVQNNDNIQCAKDSSGEEETRKYKHLTLTERGAIHGLHKVGKSAGEISLVIGHCKQTVCNELKRGTPERRSTRGRTPGYNPEYGQRRYEEKRKHCHRVRLVDGCREFIKWMTAKFMTEDWSIDSCVGYAKKHHLFSLELIPCTKTLYNAVWDGKLELKPIDLPEALKRDNGHHWKARENKRPKGTSIEQRPEVVKQREEMGHWEIDSVVGTREGQGPVVMSLVERVSDHYLSILIPGKKAMHVNEAIKQLSNEYGDKFCAVFKSITADNGSEFENLAEIEALGCSIYFSHPYSSWERPVNERHNGMLRKYLPKGKSMDAYTPAEVLFFSDRMNGLPRKRLGYRTPEEVFEDFLDTVYAA